MEACSVEQVRALAQTLRDNIGRVIVGKGEEVDLLLTALLAGGHVLLEDVPGTGKTLLAKSLAASLELSFQRIQFTPDLLPSDLTGIHFYNQKDGEFHFRPGPLFAQVILADEINRATPRTQASLLECMEERQISVDGKTLKLDRPFMVMATQNPVDNQGTFPLPDAQLDRFMIRMKLGYPSSLEGVEILKRTGGGTGGAPDIGRIAGADNVLSAQRQCEEVAVRDDLLAYIVSLAEATRNHPEVLLGVSPRGTQVLLRACRAYAALQGRSYVLPDDIKALLLPVCSHRLVTRKRYSGSEDTAGRILQELLEQIPVPSEEGMEGA
ncbi:MoxR family ATPase [Paenibacillus sp. HN-1]|uniref:AAA family ATPase n=1 Tax=Paenibacillus TaxID=44249 RepID=UPI001CA8FABD|nr:MULTISPECIES: MoxR family ATPase [Paenibacillus]MBY9077891.1 MoxR family ATPase [Paenibacillus sp. CGMCC 1.18879]MBY9088153.1 MoxR family ATPase [Paenibacillus sinensis]